MVQRIEQLNSPEDVFQAVVENSVQLSGRGSSPRELVDELCRDEGLSSVCILCFESCTCASIEGYHDHVLKN